MDYLRRIQQLYLKHIRERDKEPRFIVLVSFTLTFIAARFSAYSVKYHWLPITHSIFFKDIHIHHLVFGIILLLVAGIIRIPREDDDLIRFSSMLYGMGAALTLDEFSLWLRLNPDVYFGPQGRISIDAVILFSLILFLTVGFGNFWRKILDHTVLYLFIRNKKKHKTLKKIKRHYLWFLIFLSAIACAAGILFFLFIPVSPHALTTKPYIRKIALDKPTAICSPTNPAASVSPSISTKSITYANIQAINQSPQNDYCLQIPVLYYHHIQPQAQAVLRRQTSLSVDNGIFAQQMSYLVFRGYHTITAEQLVQALQDRTSLPQKSVVLTFDDGYKDVYDYAFPILKKYHLTANLAVPTGLLGAHAATNDYFTWDQLKEMVDSGLIYADDHTWSHYGLGLGSIDRNQLEILTGKQQLEQYLGKPQTILVYPYGSYKPWLFPLLTKDGITGAFTTKPGFLQCNSQIFALHRNRIANGPLVSYGL